jgi:hypothetical protein
LARSDKATIALRQSRSSRAISWAASRIAGALIFGAVPTSRYSVAKARRIYRGRHLNRGKWLALLELCIT